MAKKIRATEPPVSVPGRGSEQFALRLPTGLRDRIRAYADHHGRSMNTEIVRILEREFPEPLSISFIVDDLLELASVVRSGAGHDDIDRLNDALLETLGAIADGRVRDVIEPVRAEIRERLGEWQHQSAVRDFARRSEFLDEEEFEAEQRGEGTAKYPFDPVFKEDEK